MYALIPGVVSNVKSLLPNVFYMAYDRMPFVSNADRSGFDYSPTAPVLRRWSFNQCDRFRANSGNKCFIGQFVTQLHLDVELA